MQQVSALFVQSLAGRHAYSVWGREEGAGNVGHIRITEIDPAL